MRETLLALSLASLLAGSALADFIGTVNQGNAAYKKNDYKTALEKYHTAEADNPASPELDYNIATALTQQGGFEEALDRYQKAIKTTDVNLEANVHYNMGNTYFKMQDYAKAIGEYEECLKRNPKDMDAKFNLELARKRLKDQIKPQNKQDNKQQQQQQQQDQQQNQNQQNRDQQNKDKQDQNQQQNQQQQQQQKPEQGKQMSKEDAERILNALKDNEQDLQKKMRRDKVAGDYAGKDW